MSRVIPYNKSLVSTFLKWLYILALPPKAVQNQAYKYQSKYSRADCKCVFSNVALLHVC